MLSGEYVLKSKIFFLVCIVLIVCSFSGCEHEHVWEDASCFSPKTCIKCGETEGVVAGHRWASATCSAPKKCIQCGKTEGDPLGHSWSKGSATTPQICEICNDMKPLALPKNGQIFIGGDLYRYSELSIKSSTDKSCYIKLKGSSGVDVFSFFVRAGCSVTVAVPSGYYYVYFSYGEEWYGTEYLFGPDTAYAKDDELLDFKNYTWEYTLEPVSNGNFSETPIDEDEFK